MGSCEELKTLITQHAEGSLKGTDRIRVETHLCDCAACKAVFDDTRATLKLIGSVKPPEPRDGFAAELADLVYNSTMARKKIVRIAPRRLRSIAAFAALAASFVIILTAAFLYQRGSFDPAPAHRTVTVQQQTPASIEPEDVIITALSDPSTIQPASTQVEKIVKKTDIAADEEETIRATSTDIEWVEDQMADIWNDDSDDIFDELRSLTEEEAKDIYESLGKESDRTELPHGVS